jgi:hypothetical protein
MIREVRTCLLALITLGILFLPAAAIAQTEHQLCFVGECNAMTTEFRDLTLRPATIALLPPQVTLHEKKVLSTDERVSEARALEEALATDIVGNLERLGYEVVLLGDAELESDAELAALVLQANRRYDEELDRMVASELKGVKYRRYTVGAEARVLANYLQVDALAFARLEAVGASGGQQLIGFGNQGQIHLGMSLAHARTGDIEAFFGGNNTPLFGKSISSIVKKPEKVTEKVTKTAFKKMPKAMQALAPEKLDAGEVRTVQLYDPDAEADIIDDLESMLEEPAAEEPASSE